MNAVPRILFVDDEANVLQGLRRLLRAKRDAWSMRFAESGREALAMMEAEPADVIVTDMRMPEMDGAALLAEATRRNPDSVRFILSGQSDSDALFRAIGTCHQYLSKPVPSEILVDRIERSLALRRLLRGTEIRRFVSSLGSIPSPPSMYGALMAELQSGFPRVDRIEAIISGDPGVSAKILQVANSAYYGRVRTVHSLSAAINFLGLDMIKALVLNFGILTQIRCREISGRPVECICTHSVRVARVARRIAEALRQPANACSDAFIAGLLHDIGMLVLADADPERMARAVAPGGEPGVGIEARERAAFGASHAEVGAYVLGAWGFFDHIVEAVAHHHAVPEALPAELGIGFVLAVANALASERPDALPARLKAELLAGHPNLAEVIEPDTARSAA